MRPIFLEPVYKETIWGGTSLRKLLDREIPSEKTAESWEVCARENGNNKILNGEFEGQTLEELFNNKIQRKTVFGTYAENLTKFPILNKFIDANDKLSVQVHPNDNYAKMKENDSGKTELWYIIDAKPNSKIICGLKRGTTREMVKQKIMEGKLEEVIQELEVEKGNVVFIPAGAVHSLLEGIVVYEIQQNSDITYRVYDWNRVDKEGKSRELHIEKALDVIDYNFKGVVQKTSNEERSNLITCDKYFTVYNINIEGKYKTAGDVRTFFIYTIIEGSGILDTKGKQYLIQKGQSLLIPASMEEFFIEGHLKIIKTTMSC